MNIRTIKRLMPIFVALMFGVSLLGATNNLNLNSASNTKILQNVVPVQINPLKSPKSAASVSTATWWNIKWTYRVNINVSCIYNYTDYLIQQNIDFTSLLQALGVTNTALDNNSIRIIEWVNSLGVNEEIPSQFDEITSPAYDPILNAQGTVSWVMNGTTIVYGATPTIRTYFLYFDTVNNGLKQAPNYSSDSQLEILNLGTNDYALQNAKIRIAMNVGLPPNGGADYYSHEYEVYDMQTGKDLQYAAENLGWVLYNWQNYGGYNQDPYDGVTNIQVVSSGPVKAVIQMQQTAPNYIYNRYYTLNYLSNTIEIQHQVIAINAISSSSPGNNNYFGGYSSGSHWYFGSWWNPGYGGTNINAPNYAYGLGGYNWGSYANSSITLPGDPNSTSEFISQASLFGSNPLWYGWAPTSQIASVRAAGWFTEWDQSLDQGVGTIWDTNPNLNSNEPTLNRVGYQSYRNNAGRGVYLDLTPPSLSAGGNFTFTMWGQIYDNNNGTSTDYIAKGFQNPPAILIGAPFNSGKILNLKLQDIDYNPIVGATVQLTNATDQDLQYGTSNVFGNVTFFALYNTTWNIVVNYLVGAKNYTIRTDSYAINTGPLVNEIYLTLGCNLTTLNIQMVDSQISDPNYWALPNVNMTLMNATTGVVISTYLSDINGYVNVSLPSTPWNFSVAYQGPNAVPFTIVPSSDLIPSKNNTLDLVSETSVLFNLTITADKSIFYTQSVSLAQSSWLINEVNQTVNQPYYVNVYTGENVTFGLEYYDLQSQSAIPYNVSVTGGWVLSSGAQIINYSSNVAALTTGTPGYYNISVPTIYYGIGSYQLAVNLTDTGILPANYYVTINVLNFSTSLTTPGYLTVQWNTTLQTQFNYSSILPVNSGIAGASVSFYVASFTSPQSLTDNGNGGYTLSWLANLSTGNYTVIVNAFELGYMLTSNDFILQIVPIPTNFSLTIPAIYQVDPTYLRTSLNENVTFTMNFTDQYGNVLGAGATVLTSFNGNPDSADNLYPLGNGQYLFTVPASQLSNETGLYQMTLSGLDPNYNSVYTTMFVEIIDYWNTTLVWSVPPLNYPWGNNASFVVYYSCVEEPRNGPLANADITQLEITTILQNNQTQVYILSNNSIGTMWNWYDLQSNPSYGPGYYLIWFNTSVVSVNSSIAFYAIPTISLNLYRNATTNPYTWIAPIETTLTAFAFSVSSYILENLSMYLFDSNVITSTLNVTDPLSVNFGQDVNGATINFFIINQADQSVLSNGTLSNTGNGLYQFALNASQIGTYKIYLTSTLMNYSTAEFIFNLVIAPRPISYTFSKNVSSDEVVSTPQNDQVSFSIIAIDADNGSPLTGGILSVLLDGKNLTFTDSATPGVYTVTLTPAELAQLSTNTPTKLVFYLSKANYATAKISLTLSVGLPADPIFGVPYLYWIIIGVTIIAILALFGIVRYVQYSNIPLIVKQINSTMKVVSKRKPISAEKVTVSEQEDFLEENALDWRYLDLDLASILKNPKTPEFNKMTPEDMK